MLDGSQFDHFAGRPISQKRMLLRMTAVQQGSHEAIAPTEMRITARAPGDEHVA
jgi:hypothetical protein